MGNSNIKYNCSICGDMNDDLLYNINCKHFKASNDKFYCFHCRCILISGTVKPNTKYYCKCKNYFYMYDEKTPPKKDELICSKCNNTKTMTFGIGKFMKCDDCDGGGGIKCKCKVVQGFNIFGSYTISC
jgi:hypothetical protein